MEPDHAKKIAAAIAKGAQQSALDSATLGVQQPTLDTTSIAIPSGASTSGVDSDAEVQFLRETSAHSRLVGHTH